MEQTLTQLGLFPDEPKPSGPRWRAFLVTHRHGYPPEAPERTWIGAWDSEAEAKREAREHRKGRTQAAHIELEQMDS